MIDRQDILRHLDGEAESFDFPMLDNGYYYHGDQKMTIFQDERGWAILLEILAYNTRDFGIDRITMVANVYGDCLTGWDDNDKFYCLAEDDEVETFLHDQADHLAICNRE